MTTLAIVCAPNLGAVDGWLPVLLAARNEHPDWRIVLVVPGAWQKRIDPEGAALRMASRVCDEVSVEVLPGDFRATADFPQAVSLISRTGRWPKSWERVEHAVRRLLRAAMGARPCGDSWARAATGVIAVAGRVAIRERRSELLQRRSSGRVVVCYDFEENEKPEIKRVLAFLPEAERLSLRHGLGIPIDPAKMPSGTVTPRDHRVYAYSAEHATYYRRAAGISSEKVVVTGVPRHDPVARQAIEALSLADIDAEWHGCVLLVSRQATSDHEQPAQPRDWLPAGRKAEQLRAIHRVVCEKEGLRLLISRHPKDRNDNTFERSLPENQRGVTWRFTSGHPLALAKHVEFAIAFSSGVALDLLVCGVPTIEFQNVSGATAFDRADAVRDARGRILRTEHRRGGLVVPADDEKDLEEQVRRIRTNRIAVLAELMFAYRTSYAPPNGAVQRILRDLELIAGKSASRPTASPY